MSCARPSCFTVTKPDAGRRLRGRHVAAAALALGLGSTPALAADLNTFDQISQTQFQQISSDLGSALSYKGLVPAETTGPLGFDLGVAVTATRLEHSEALGAAAGGADISGTFAMPSLRANKGLPFGFSVGGMLAQSESTDIRVLGGEVRWALVPGDIVMPAIALRGAFTKVTGIDQLDFDTRSIDVSISKGLLMLTPYAGIGRVQVNSTPEAATGLSGLRLYQTRTFVGLNVNLGFNLAFEADRTGDVTSYGVKAGLRF